MNNLIIKKIVLHGFLLFILQIVFSQSPAKNKISVEKQNVLDYLAQPEVVEKYGKISDAIWSYAELGLQNLLKKT
ncbi:MAG: hypothetical protein U9N53_13560 [Bacteroidota bacterium]|nr:hypothetical protein [Bacteroidota bacterium]